MALHEIEPTRQTLHGSFSRDWPPILTIDPGDTVCFCTLDAAWGLTGPEAPRSKFEPRIPGRDDGHALCGPIAIRGAEPGMTLEVELRQILPGEWGWTEAGGWDSALNQRLGVVGGKSHRLDWRLDARTMTGRDQFGRTVALAPFMGVMGMPPDEPGVHSTGPPRQQGGNIDCRELVAGSALFLPIAVPGGLFSVGDGHAAQGDGEASGVAIECPMQRVEIAFHLHERGTLPLQAPHARTPAGWITFGFHQDLNEATVAALDAMLLLMQAQHGLERRHALALASVVVHLRITQVVNGVRGVHALLPHDAIRRGA
jgi:acetamidase/formamidase